MCATRNSLSLSAGLPLVVGLSVAAALLAGCGSTEDPAASDAAAAGEELGHVHSLDVNPADDTLYVASHHGVFALGADGFERVGEARFDAMSFTIADADRFLMSGHPEPGAGGPAHFGLSESKDSGRTWRSLSLEGAADFHALEASGDRVYGVDSQSGRLMSTEDGKRWRDLGQLPAADVAAHPGNPDLVLLTDGSGSLVRLQVPGSPEVVESAPRLVLLDWDSEDLLVGAGPEGSVYRSVDGGDTWREVGSLPDVPHALTATESRWYAATGVGVHVSTDAGATWSEVGRP
ncbi:F510_1955 family glycosylhydrolase [Nocardioides furvisabuli]|uniref:Exo-alpha-sialidase n=1 Tax=Nocardioides furvisabuli TaxID=375542 RepID=A0ABP5IKG0_9ACTN|nr:exo-alpha-sialidase [Nocardioides furvisabuli]